MLTTRPKSSHHFEIDEQEAILRPPHRFRGEHLYPRQSHPPRLLIDERPALQQAFVGDQHSPLNQLDIFDRLEADKAVEIRRNAKDGTVDLNLESPRKVESSPSDERRRERAGRRIYRTDLPEQQLSGTGRNA